MEKSYLKINAKKRMVKNNFKCFMVGVIPFLTIILLLLFNYYLLILLRQTDFSFNPFTSIYAEYIRMSLVALSLIASFCLWKSIALFSHNFFFLKVINKKTTYSKAIKQISFRQCVTFWTVSIVRFLLSVSWSVVFFLPCLVVSLLLIYCYRYENYGFSVNITLFTASILLLVLGFSYFFITLKRYSMCEYLILTRKESNPFRVITKSIEIMENHCVEYALYSLSFGGWILSCLLVVPAIYVIPYINLSKWCYMNSLVKVKDKTETGEKPIIFYIQKRVEN